MVGHSIGRSLSLLVLETKRECKRGEVILHHEDPVEAIY